MIEKLFKHAVKQLCKKALILSLQLRKKVLAGRCSFSKAGRILRIFAILAFAFLIDAVQNALELIVSMHVQVNRFFSSQGFFMKFG